MFQLITRSLGDAEGVGIAADDEVVLDAEV